MKKSVVLLLACMLLPFGGCADKDDVTPPSAAEIEVISPDRAEKLSAEDAEAVETILKSGKWIDDIAKCEPDCQLLVDGNKIYYHSECGTFNDFTEQRSLTTDESTQRMINKLLEKYITLGQFF